MPFGKRFIAHSNDDTFFFLLLLQLIMMIRYIISCSSSKHARMFVLSGSIHTLLHNQKVFPYDV